MIVIVIFLMQNIQVAYQLLIPHQYWQKCMTLIFEYSTVKEGLQAFRKQKNMSIDYKYEEALILTKNTN